MKRWFKLVLILLFVPFHALLSQEDKIKEQIKAQLNSNDKKNIEKAEKKQEGAINTIKSLDESGDGKKALKGKISASHDLGKANKLIYRVYKQDLKRFFENVDAVQKKKAELKIDRAELLMKEAKKKREASLRLNVLENAFEIVEKANKYEKKAIDNLIDVYEMFIGSSPINKTALEKQNETINDNSNNKIKTKEAIPDNENATNEANVSKKENNEVVTEKVRQFEPIKIKGSQGVFYLIQVAASKSPISDASLRRSYEKDVCCEKFGMWYKYFINVKFPSVEQAEAYKENLDAKGTFVVAFKNGEKVSFEEAESIDDVKEVVRENRKITTPTNEDVVKIVYRLEIGISTKRLPAAEVRRFKNGGKPVIPVDRGGWYSYTIGDFKTQTEALSFKRAKDLTDAIVIKLKNGIIVDE